MHNILYQLVGLALFTAILSAGMSNYSPSRYNAFMNEQLYDVALRSHRQDVRNFHALKGRYPTSWTELTAIPFYDGKPLLPDHASWGSIHSTDPIMTTCISINIRSSIEFESLLKVQSKRSSNELLIDHECALSTPITQPLSYPTTAMLKLVLN